MMDDAENIDGNREQNAIERVGEQADAAEKPAGFASFPAAESRWKKWGADSIKAALALLLLILGVLVWWQPPLVAAKSPRVVYTFQGKNFRDAELFTPLSVPTRYYIRLPHELARRYRWFAVDRRREVAALAKEPERGIFGHYMIRRGDPLGQDLEFTKIDGLEWRVWFYADSVVFSNAILCVRLEK